jgi:hypothetical protein
MERNQRLQDVVLGYLQAVDAGQATDQQDLLARHPDLAADFELFSPVQNPIPARVINSFFESISLGFFKSGADDW